MSKSKKPRKAHNPHKLYFAHQHPLLIAGQGCTKLTQKEIEQITHPFLEALVMLREGRGMPDSIASVNTVLRILKRAEQQNIITGMTAYVAKCEDSIESICSRAHAGDMGNPWKSPTLRAVELESLYVIRDLLLHAVSNLSVREVDSIARYIRARAKTEGAKIIAYQYEPT